DSRPGREHEGLVQHWTRPCTQWPAWFEPRPLALVHDSEESLLLVRRALWQLRGVVRGHIHFHWVHSAGWSWSEGTDQTAEVLVSPRSGDGLGALLTHTGYDSAVLQPRRVHRPR